MSKVLITDKLSDTGIDILKESCQVDYKPGLAADELSSIIKDYDALLVRSQTKATRDILENAANLKIIGRAGVGVDNIDLEAATEKGIIVVNSPEGNTIAAAEHTVALMMSLARHIPSADRSCKQNKWERSEFLGTELKGHSLGVVGLGKIGQHVAKVALALGMKVNAYDPFVSDERADDLGVKKVELNGIFRSSDFITLHIPKNKETMNLIDRESIDKMKTGVRIVNCARGGLINEQDLADAINSGKVAGAAIDVFESEPCTDSPLHNCGDKVILTPHLGASTNQAQLNVAVDVAEQIRDVLGGGVARSAVNLPGLKPELVKHIKHYLALVEYMGSMSRQLAQGVIKEIEIEALGELSGKNIDGIKLAILKGVLSVHLDSVSFVNAPLIAKERGIKVTELKSEDSGAYIDKVRVTLKTDQGERTIAGTVLQGDIPAIVQIDGFPVNIRPENHSIVTFHNDQPGVVAQVSQILFESGINISGLNLGRKKDTESSSAVMVINVDGQVADDDLAKIEGLDGINIAKYVQLKGT